MSLNTLCLKSVGNPTYQAPSLFCLCSHVAEIKKQREFYQKLGMEVPGDIKGDLCNMKTHLDQRNGTLPHILPHTLRVPARFLSLLRVHQV